MFKKNIYKGQRYVPLVLGDWDYTKQTAYEQLTVVAWRGCSYTSKKPVPKGIDIYNESYWVQTGNYNVQTELYRRETQKLMKQVDINTHNISLLEKLKMQIVYCVRFDGTDESKKVQKYVDSLDPEKGGVVYIPSGKTLMANFTLNKKNFLMTGGGTLRGSVTVTGQADNSFRPWNWVIDNIHFSKMPSSMSDYKHQNIKDNDNAINLQNTLRGKITNCTFYFYDKAINFMPYDKAWQVGRVLMSSNSFHGVKYAVYGEKPKNGTNPLTIGDSQFINNHVEYAFVTGIHLEGVDGFQCEGNVFFSPVSSDNANDNNKIKKHNIYIDGCDWTNIIGNTCFEAGEDAIKLGHFQHVNCTNNLIGMPGQLIPSDGIRMWGGDLSGKEYCISKVSDNNIMRPTKSGIVVDKECGHVTIQDNTIYEAGASNYYIGTIDLNTVAHYGIVYVGLTSITASGNYSPLNEVLVIESPRNTRFLNVDRKFAGTDNSYKRLTLSNGNADTVIDVSRLQVVVLNQAPNTVITDIKGGVDGKTIDLWAFGANTTLSRSVGYLKDDTNVTMPRYSFITLKMVDGMWCEYHRSF